ncbi:hypothetical protein [Pararhodospirillum photometricum]|uniref:hypothetical protein n=1 Tax=Pararhodospirillum photometricum TaxID=1084 RepID=UPI0002FE68FF|nr:hypothetical protein [Pararhodospirillum photometricum]
MPSPPPMTPPQQGTPPLGLFSDKPMVYPLIFTTGAINSIKICVFGGDHRIDGFSKIVVPAINNIAESRRIECYIVSSKEIDFDFSANVEVHRFEKSMNYGLLLGRLRTINPDIIIHPPTKATGNLPFKTLNLLINAAFINAVPVAADQQPFSSIKDLGICVVCPGTEEGWTKGLHDAIELHSDQSFLIKLRLFVSQNFNGQINKNVISEIIKSNDIPGYLHREQRFCAIKDLFLERTQNNLMPTQGSDLNSLIENHYKSNAKNNELGFERIMFLKSISNWPPNVLPINPEQFGKSFLVKNCFGVEDKNILPVVASINIFMENVVTAMTAAYDYIYHLGVWNDYWTLMFGSDLRESGYQEIKIEPKGTLLGIVFCLRIHPNTNGHFCGAVYDSQGNELAVIHRDLRSITGMVPMLVTFPTPLSMDKGNIYTMRLYVENATDFVQFIEFVQTSKHYKGPGERKIYYSAVYDIESN